MELATGTKIRYTSAAGTREAVVKSIKVGPTAKPGFLNTWLTLEIPVRLASNLQPLCKSPRITVRLKCFALQLSNFG